MRALFILLLFGTAFARAQAPLSEEEVLEASGQHFPSILKAMADRRVAQGRAVEALGAFDLLFSAQGSSRLDGYYDGDVVAGKVEKPIRPLGGKLYSQYKLSNGDFPIYEDEYYTNTGGQFKVGVLFSLLRDRDIDGRRAGEVDAELALRQADLEVLLTRVGVQQRALVAYWRWVAAGQQLKVYENLLTIARERQVGLQKQVDSGRRAKIFLTENQQNITRRETLVRTAERDFLNAANALAFYLRDTDGEPLTPDPLRLPDMPSTATASDGDLMANTINIDNVLYRRPELQILQTAADRARQQVQLAENQLKPRLDLNFEVADGLGAIAEGGPSRDSTDTMVGLTFSVPLERRVAKGKLSQAQAKLDALQYERRRLEDQVTVELRNILVDLNAARDLMQLAAREVEQSEIMREAEVQRFQQGASDFFLVNVREETAADARIRFLASHREARIARANYDAATVNLPRLGIEP